MPADTHITGAQQTTSTEESMFAPTPIWARETNKKRGRRMSAARAGAVGEDSPVSSAGEDSTGSAADDHVAYQAIRPRERRHGAPPAALAAGAVALVALAGVGWYAAQPRDSGVPALTPGSPAASEAPLATPGATQVAAASTPPALGGSSTTATTTAASHTGEPTATQRPTPTHRSTAVATRATTRRAPAEPAASSSVEESGVDASTIAPMTAAPPPAAPVSPAPSGAAMTPAQPVPSLSATAPAGASVDTAPPAAPADATTVPSQ